MARAGGLPLPTITDDRALGAADIQRSLRFNKGDNPVLTRSPSTTTNSTKQTLSFWFKINSLIDATNQGVLFAGGSDGSYAYAQFWSNTFYFGNSAGPYWNGSLRLRDFSAWYHGVIVIDTTQSTADDRQKFYLNGVQQAKGNAGSNNPNQNDNYEFLTNSSWTYYIGKRALNDMNFDGYMSEINFVQGQALEPTQFGFTDGQTGIWMPKRYEGTYGTNGFYLDFSDNSSTTTLGIDKSPNGNDWTLNNFSVSAGADNDSFTYTPTNQIPTFHSLYTSQQSGGSVTYSEGNLKIATSASSSNYARYPFAMSSPHLAVNSGKWYAEFKCNSTKCAFGVCNTGQLDSDMTNNPYGAAARTSIIYTSEGQLRGNNSDIRNGNGAFTTNDIIGIALDLDNMKIYFHKNGTYINSGNPNTGANPDTVQDLQVGNSGGYIFQAGSDGMNSVTLTANFGQHAFSYSIPTGYKTLTSNKLPDNVPSIINPKQNFAAITYTGAGSNTNITGLLFEPGLIWCKSRTQAYSHYIFDSVRGFGGNNLIPNSQNAEGSDATSISSTHVSGFYIGAASGISDTYQAPNNNVAWCWKAGGNSNTYNIDGKGYATVSAAGLDGGSINPTGASVNTEAGFSIIKYTGTGSNATIAHGLGKAPAWIICKSRSNSSDWRVYHQSLGNTTALKLNTTDASATVSTYWNDTSPTSTTVSFGTEGDLNGSGRTHVMYCWAEIPGYSKFGSYEGNNNSDGTYVPLGFRPAWVMIKNIEANSTEWYILDAARDVDNPVGQYLSASSNAVESTYIFYDFLSDGFKLRNTGSAQNPSQQTIIYMAFAEQPVTTPFDTFPNAR